jgi:hypothetical protein
MRWFRRRSGHPTGERPEAPSPTDARRATLAHLADFARTRVGVEAYGEPATRVTSTTVVLVAATGEWTRRRVPDPRAAFDLARGLEIPVYDVHLTGYPQRMRDWTSRERARHRAAGRST